MQRFSNGQNNLKPSYLKGLHMQRTNNTDNTTLSQFALSIGVNKGTVSRKAKALGISTSNGLTPANVEALKKAFNVLKGTEIQVFTGNHRTTIDTPPPVGSSINLARFRGDMEVSTYADPTTQAANAIALIDAVTTAMDADLDARFATLQQTQETNRLLAEKAAELRAKELEYRTTQNVLARFQNAETAQLTDLLGKAQGLVSEDS
jgi:hypothetical protein